MVKVILEAYKTDLIKSGWDLVEQNGTSISVENEARDYIEIYLNLTTLLLLKSCLTL